MTLCLNLTFLRVIIFNVILADEAPNYSHSVKNSC